MATGQDVALKPALAIMFREHLHDAAVGGVAGVELGIQRPLIVMVCRLEHAAHAVGGDLVGADDAEVPLGLAGAKDVGEVTTQRGERGGLFGARP